MIEPPAEIALKKMFPAWIRSNLLLLVRLTLQPVTLYENQFAYRLKIRLAASALLMLHALSLESQGSLDKFRSSLQVNNFQTLDIRYYLTGEGLPNWKSRPGESNSTSLLSIPSDCQTWQLRSRQKQGRPRG
ncbi:hypothetical protein SAMN05216337_105022 [Bradyrhizobium brasilense]|uniref:Uncharacterized protein n=1 Tax=Bradyrhizobium brasilense TaxID=1419277 RepID=A0A1G7JV40_9BRAD|nr:hypothetical protein [Bradyrhizobium brasilense]SDF28731.1 hypothetical protein SAMN05216337_105022 [Bradyrhizobium brasilense]